MAHLLVAPGGQLCQVGRFSLLCFTDKQDKDEAVIDQLGMPAASIYPLSD